MNPVSQGDFVIDNLPRLASERAVYKVVRTYTSTGYETDLEGHRHERSWAMVELVGIEDRHRIIVPAKQMTAPALRRNGKDVPFKSRLTGRRAATAAALFDASTPVETASRLIA